VRRPDPDNGALKEAAALLKECKCPLIIAGNGAVRKNSFEQLRAFVQKHNIPIVHTFMGQGAVPDSFPQSLFTIGFGFRDIVMDAVELADLVITVGYDIVEYAPDQWNPLKDKTIIHIDFTPAEVYAHYQPAVEIVADISATLSELNRTLFTDGCRFNPQWYKPVREKIVKDIASYAPVPDTPFSVPGVLNVLQSQMEGNDLLISDVGTHKIWIARNFSACCPNGCIISNGLASMGIALPGAIAAALHDPNRRIIAAMGDGGFMMNSQELETARRLRLSFINIVFNDNDYGLISWKQHMHRGRSVGTHLGNPDFKSYTESFGIKGYRPENWGELASQLSHALTARELCVFEIPVDTGVNEALIEKLTVGRK
jgi:acetolactate synthase I/II/III large subunit